MLGRKSQWKGQRGYRILNLRSCVRMNILKHKEQRAKEEDYFDEERYKEKEERKKSYIISKYCYHIYENDILFWQDSFQLQIFQHSLRY